ncbi:tyrosine-protein phosphatase [Verrucomicrobiota bacterium]
MFKRIGLWFRGYQLSPLTAGRLYRAGEMPPRVLKRVCRRLGIRTVVDLRHERDRRSRRRPKLYARLVREEAEALQSIGVRYCRIVGRQTPPQETVEQFLDVVENEANQPVLMHCEDGLGRSGVFAAIYRIECEGWDNERAHAEAAAFGSVRPGGRKHFRPGTTKGDYILAYRPRGRA